MDALSVGRAIRGAPLLRRADRLWNALQPSFDSLLRLLYGRRGIAVELEGGERIRLDPRCRQFVGSSDARSGETDPLFEAMLDELRPGDRFADVGANIGVYTIVAARRGATVTAYEPHPVTAALLRRNVALNGVTDRVTVHEAAIGASVEELQLSEGGVYRRESRIDPGGSVHVEATPLTGEFDVLKIDVEGYELEVLRGAAALFADPALRPRVVLLELHVALLERAGEDPRSFEELLPGYSTVRIAVRGLAEHWVARANR